MSNSVHNFPISAHTEYMQTKDGKRKKKKKADPAKAMKKTILANVEAIKWRYPEELDPLVRSINDILNSISPDPTKEQLH